MPRLPLNRRQKSPGGRIEIALVCTVCGSRNYKTTKIRRDGTEPLKLKKFCKTCNAHTEHIESK